MNQSLHYLSKIKVVNSLGVFDYFPFKNKSNYSCRSEWLVFRCLSVASLEKPMNEIRRIEIVFKGELFLGTFSAHEKKYQVLKQKFKEFLKRI